MAKKNKKSKRENLKSEESSTKKVLVKTTSSKRPVNVKSSTTNNRTLVFGKENYKFVGIGLALITLGMLLMMGGFNENPAVFDKDLIYSFRRTTLAPFLILSGLVVEIYAIFK